MAAVGALGGNWVPIQHNVIWAEAYLYTKWHLDPSSHLATTDMGRKLGRGLRPLFVEAVNTMSSGLRPTSIWYQVAS